MSNLQKTFNAPSTQELDQLIKFCQVLASAPFYQKMGPGGVMAIYLTAKEMGLPFMACLNQGMYTFDGKVTLSAQLMNMLIDNAGHQANVLRLDETICELEFVRCDRKGEGSRFKYNFSIEQAQKAGYMSKDNWRKHPRDMLFSRALSGGARKFMPKVLMNSYVIGEMDDDTPIEPMFSEPDEQNTPANTPALIENTPVQAQTHQLLDTNFPNNQCQEFINKYDIYLDHPAGQYVSDVCKRANMSFEQVVTASVKNPERFEAGFKKWCDENGDRKINL